MTLRSRFTESHSFADDFVSYSPVISGSSDQSPVIFMQPRVFSSTPAPEYAYLYSDTTDIVLLGISSVLFVIVLGIYFIRKYFYPPVEIPPAEINSTTSQQHVDQRPRHNTNGLDRKIIKGFPIMTYSPAEIAKNHPGYCAVCLSEFQEGERAQLLPKCGHVFHLECVEKWLFSHSTCPLCRVNLIPESHTITIDSNSPNAIAGQETLDPAAPVNGEGIAALSEETIATNNGAQMRG